MRVEEYAGYDAIGLMQLPGTRQVSDFELQRCPVEAFERRNPRLNPMASTASLDQPWERDRPFPGAPFPFKEGQGWLEGAASMGSRLTVGLKNSCEIEIVRRLRLAGVQIMRETTAPDFGIYPVTESGRHGTTRNPRSLARSPGGSCGRSSSAVAAGVEPVAQIGDGGGSIRGPAHCTGIFNLKPTRGRTRSGQRGLYPFAHVHVSSRTVGESAAFLDAVHGAFPGGTHAPSLPMRLYLEEVGSAPGRLSIGVLRHSRGRTAVSEECLGAIDGAARLAESFGHRFEEAQPILNWEEWLSHFFAAWIHPLPLFLNRLGTTGGCPTGMNAPIHSARSDE